MFLGRVLVIKITQCPDIKDSLLELFETPEKGSVRHLREFVIVLSLWVFQGSTTLRLASRGPSGYHEPPEDPPCDASIESSSRWCGALVRHPREQCNVHSIPIPFNVTKLSHLFPPNQRNWGPRSAAKGSHGLDTGEIKLWGIARRNDSKISKHCTK
ncbi:hypothetical protein TNCV_874221 [Trichonephila clavipes]|nr:hypothetical protein TNCV_874221 [Trichonephila clavipes]